MGRGTSFASSRGLKSSLLNLQEKYLQQGEEMRKMRIRMHNQAQAINRNTDEITGLKRDIVWGKRPH